MKVIHVLADGTVVDKIDGHVVKPEVAPELYKILKTINQEKKEALSNGKI